MLLRPGVLPSKPPTVDVAPEASSYDRGLEALQIAELAGLELDDWQQYCLLRALATDEDGLWAAFEVALVVSRQTGKSEVLVAVILAGLYTRLISAEDLRLIIFAAHEYKTAREIFLRLRLLLDPPPDAHPLMYADASLLAQVKTIRTANGEESIELQNGRRVRFLARTSGSGRGFTGDMVLLDEAYKLNQEQMSALLPTMGARPNPQIWYASMGPFEDSEVQLAIMDRARSDDPGALCYLGWEAPADAAVDDRDWWVKCNPAHPHRMTMDTLENEFRALGPQGFAREKLCMKTSSVDRVIPADMWVAVQGSEGPGDHVEFALDVSVDRSHYAIAAADDSHVELVEYEPVRGVVERVSELVGRYTNRVVVDGSGPAASLIPELEAAGVHVESAKSGEMVSACGRFYDALSDRDVAVFESQVLNTAVSGAARKPSGDAWKWSRSLSNQDISPLVAATLAFAYAASRETPEVWLA